MENYELNLIIEANDIFSKLSEKDKNRFKEIKITEATLVNDKSIHIKCLLLENPVKKI